MNKHSSIGARGSLLERATNLYDFSAAIRGRAAPVVDVPADLPPVPLVEPATFALDAFVPSMTWTGPVQRLDRARLAESGFIVPGGMATALSEEFRLVKRDLIAQLEGNPVEGNARGNRILICSAHSGEGKTFCAINLALSLAAERDREVLLVDADFGKPGIPEALGLTSGPGLMDALADPSVRLEDIVLRTDLPSLAVLPAGQRSNADTEHLASARTAALLDRLTAGRPDRIVIFDSPPLLAASPAAVLARHAAVALMVVRADMTAESALRDAVSMLKGGAQIQLLLNAVQFSASGRRFGSYYAKGD